VREGERWTIVDSVSMAIGVVLLAERLGRDRVCPDAYAGLVDETAQALAAFEARHRITPSLSSGTVQMLGTSGTVTTLSGIRQQLPRYERALVDGSSLDLAEIQAVCAELRSLDWKGRAAQPCIGSERADLVLAGCAILEGILKVWPVPRLKVADRGLREGILLGLMREAAAGR
jgi:exopolyphosphatase / guanosine-5'-triphosphate,3'-diphosphate pyrophosphatase